MYYWMEHYLVLNLIIVLYLFTYVTGLYLITLFKYFVLGGISRTVKNMFRSSTRQKSGYTATNNAKVYKFRRIYL